MQEPSVDVLARRAQKLEKAIEKIEAVLKCRLCGEMLRKPIMECAEGGHLYCAECLNQEHQQRGGGGAPANCPICGESVALSNNRVLERMQDLLISEATTLQPRAAASNTRSLI